MRPTDAEIRQFATRKRPASGAGPSRPPKKPAPATPIIEASVTDQSEPVIALAASATRSEERPMGEAAEGTSAASLEAVEPDVVRETEHHPTASVAAAGGAGSTSSIPSLSVPSVGAADRGKAPMDPADETRSGSRSVPPSAQFPEGASALADHNLTRRLCQGILLPTDVESLRSRQVTEMLSRFYPTMVELIYTMSELEAGYRRFGNIRAAYKERSAAAEAERAMLADHLQQSADREAKLVDEVSRLGSELKSARKEARHKGRAVRRLRHERDGATAELQGEREQLRVSLEKLAKAEEELSIAQADADIAKAERSRRRSRSAGRRKRQGRRGSRPTGRLKTSGSPTNIGRRCSSRVSPRTGWGTRMVGRQSGPCIRSSTLAASSHRGPRRKPPRRWPTSRRKA
ncbi:uncharacterized protein [Elaeis guineensis]|uniref:uncharacterized protein n=1 Tax=Elaeis guineensis var. tenera TaxID=51953 RepID=UPI003C6D6B74